MVLTAIDFETANRSMASVCAVGISSYENGKAQEKYYSLIHPADNVSWFNSFNVKVHGIHPEDVEDAPDFHEVYEEIEPMLSGNLVCAHNAPFDMACLIRTCENCNLPLPEFRWFDTVALCRKMFPEMKHHRLDDMCSYLNIPLNHHHAGSDACGCLMIAVKAMELTGMDDMEELLSYYEIRVHTLRKGRQRA